MNQHLELPASLADFTDRFGDEPSSRELLASLRWPGGFRCPRCDHDSAGFIATRGLYECRACGYQASLRTGSVMESSHLELNRWVRAAFLVASGERGLSPARFKRHLGLSRYDTAWNLVRKLRAAMEQHNDRPLSGVVEVDEMPLRIRETIRDEWTPAYHVRRKVFIIGAVEVTSSGPGRIRLEIVTKLKGETMAGFVKRVVAPGSAVITSGHRGYLPLARAPFEHRQVRVGLNGDPAEVLPVVHGVFAGLKSWLPEGKPEILSDRIPALLEEYAFRHNCSGDPTEAFRRLLGVGT